ncbi:MAG: hypothetical protein ACC628_24890 [Pirellulaceae bacterium]
MRTTIDIHDELLERAKRFASSCNKRLADVVNDALQQALSRVEQPAAGLEPFRLATYGSGGVRPGIDLSDNGSIQDALDESARDSDTGQMDFDALR